MKYLMSDEIDEVWSKTFEQNKAYLLSKIDNIEEISEQAVAVELPGKILIFDNGCECNDSLIKEAIKIVRESALSVQDALTELTMCLSNRSNEQEKPLAIEQLGGFADLCKYDNIFDDLNFSFYRLRLNYITPDYPEFRSQFKKSLKRYGIYSPYVYFYLKMMYCGFNAKKKTMLERLTEWFEKLGNVFGGNISIAFV